MRTLTVALIIGVMAAGAMATPPLQDFLVNTTTYGLQYNSAVGAQHVNGGIYVASFASEDRGNDPAYPDMKVPLPGPPQPGADSSQVRGQLYTGAWNTQGAEFRISTTPHKSGAWWWNNTNIDPAKWTWAWAGTPQRNAVDMATNGDFIASWTCDNVDVRVRSYNVVAGVPTPQFAADVLVASPGVQAWSGIEMADDSSQYIVMFNDGAAAPGGLSWQIRNFATDGLIASGTVPGTLNGSSHGRAAAIPTALGGGYMVTYFDVGAGASTRTQRVIKLSAAGVQDPAFAGGAGELLVFGAGIPAYSENNSPIGCDSTGGFVVSGIIQGNASLLNPLWDTNDEVLAARFDVNGNAIGGIIDAGPVVADQNMWPGVAVADDGSFIMSYSSRNYAAAGSTHDTVSVRFSKYGGAVDAMPVLMNTTITAGGNAYEDIDCQPNMMSLTAWDGAGMDAGLGYVGSYAVWAAGQMGFLYGDADLNNSCDGFDLLTWGGSYGTAGPHTWATADFTNDGIVDGFDLLEWGSGYGSLVVPVPEPATMALLAIGGLALLRRRRR